jgi:hypothetical protein
MSRYAITLHPNAWELRGKLFKLDEREWKRALELVATPGCQPNAFAGLDKRSAADFATHLGQALRAGANSDALLSLLTFITGPGVGGFTLSRGFAY